MNKIYELQGSIGSFLDKTNFKAYIEVENIIYHIKKGNGQDEEVELKFLEGLIYEDLNST